MLFFVLLCTNNGARKLRYPKDCNNMTDQPNVIGRAVAYMRRHPVLSNIVLIFIVACVVAWLIMRFLDFWTHHGEQEQVPDLKGMSYVAARDVLHSGNLKAEITDSIFDDTYAPGTVVEQSPHSGAWVKPWRTVYLTIVAFSPKMVTVPDYYNVSMRQGVSMFEGLGVKEVKVVAVPSEYRDLVLSAKFNGLEIRPGTRIPASAIITLEVGSGYDTEEEETEITTDEGE